MVSSRADFGGGGAAAFYAGRGVREFRRGSARDVDGGEAGGFCGAVKGYFDGAACGDFEDESVVDGDGRERDIPEFGILEQKK